ncbi:hypothetical protein [Micromonospora sp. NPDC047527]|uniref:hypothetical protein n=1 Tax=unclassified Micromonospora TaxID=2617518 RepID=UPI0033EE4CA1
MNAATDGELVSFAGHSFSVHTDQAFRGTQEAHLRSFIPDADPAPACGHLTPIRVHHDEGFFYARMTYLQASRSRAVLPFRGEPYRSSQVGRVSWWRPDPDSHLREDHLYARDARGRLHVVLHPGTEHGQRYAMRVIREVVLRCAEGRGWTAFHAAAAAVDGRGVLIAGPSGAGKTTVLAALGAYRQADVIAADRAVITGDAERVVGVPISVRIADGTLSALGPRHDLPSPRRLPPEFGHARKVACSPRDFAHAFAARVRDSAPLRLVVLPQLSDDSRKVRLALCGAPLARAALSAVGCTPHDEDWLHPWFAERTRSLDELSRQGTSCLEALIAKVPVMRVTVGVRTPGLLLQIADAVTKGLT